MSLIIKWLVRSKVGRPSAHFVASDAVIDRASLRRQCLYEKAPGFARCDHFVGAHRTRQCEGRRVFCELGMQLVITLRITRGSRYARR